MLRKFLVTVAMTALVPLSSFAGNRELLEIIAREARESESDSVMIVQNGEVVFSEFYGEADRPRNVQSVTKSVCAIAIMILLEEGKIESLDVPMSRWIPAWTHDPMKSKITLGMILNNTSGLPDTQARQSDPPGAISVPDFFVNDDLVKAAAEAPLNTMPGLRFMYSSLGASLLQPVIKEASGQSVTAFVQAKIFDKLDITDASWRFDRAGQETTSGGLFLSTRDLVKIGQLMLGEGTYQGRQVFTPASARRMMAKSQPFRDYGLLWWIDYMPSETSGGLIAAHGWGGQYIAILPEKNLVAVRTRDPYILSEFEIDRYRFRDFIDLVYWWE